MKKLIFVLLIVISIFLVACEGIDLSGVSDEDLERISGAAVVCNEPYIRFGASCCLDQNNNNICDNDEKPKEDKTFKEPVGGETAGEETATEEEVEEELAIEEEEELVKEGEDNAPITIIEFSDFSCPFCAAAAGENQQVIDYLQSRDPSWEAPVPKIMEKYVKTGKVKLVFKYFPGHGTGGEAMKLAWCANEQGKFWEVHDAFFANQGDIENVAKLKTLAARAGVNLVKLEKCYNSNRYANKLTSDVAEGKVAGVQGTPVFIVNGRMLSGAQSFTALQQVIEAELEEEGLGSKFSITPLTNEITLAEEASFSVTITNSERTARTYTIYGLDVDWSINPEIKKFTLQAGKSKTFLVRVKPLRFFTSSTYNLKLYIDSSLSPETTPIDRYKEDLPVILYPEEPLDYLPEIGVTVSTDRIAYPGSPFSIKLSLENQNSLDLSGLKIRIQSEMPEFVKEASISLPPLGKKDITFIIIPNEHAPPKEHSLFFIFERDGETVKVMDKKIEVEPVITSYSNVAVSLTSVQKQWKGTWGKITHLSYTIKNNEEGTIRPSYFMMTVEGYDEEAEKKKISLPVTSQDVKAGQIVSGTIAVLGGFNYNQKSAGALENVRISVILYDANNKPMASYTKEYDLREKSASCEKKCNFKRVVILTSDGEVFSLNPGEGSYTWGGALEWKVLETPDYCSEYGAVIPIQLTQRIRGRTIGERILLRMGETSATITSPENPSLFFTLTLKSVEEQCDNEQPVLPEEVEELSCGKVISKDDTFALEGNIFQYKGADKQTDTSPKIKFKDIDAGESVEMSPRSQSGLPVFTLTHNGVRYTFQSASDYNKDDYDIVLPCAMEEEVIELTIGAKKWLFVPNKITVNKGDYVKLYIVPDAGFTFNFALPSFGVEKFVSGRTAVEFIANEAGSFEFKCSSCEEWRGMVGTIEVLGEEPVITSYSQVAISLTGVQKQWKGTWGKITHLSYTIKNNEEGTIRPSYFMMAVEGYDDEAEKKKITLPVSSQDVKAGQIASGTVTVPGGFNYNQHSVGPLDNVRITVLLYDTNDKPMASYTKEFNLRG